MTLIFEKIIKKFFKFQLTWFKDSIILPASTRYTTYYDMNTNVATLKIDSAQLNDLGTYIVLGENEAGRDQTFCTLHIEQVPNIDQTPMVNPEAFRYLEQPVARKPLDVDDDSENLMPPKVIVPLQDLQLKEGEPVFLICKIDGKPKPKVFLVYILPSCLLVILFFYYKISFRIAFIYNLIYYFYNNKKN